MPFQVFDVWDQSALTDEITRPPAGRDPGAAEDTSFAVGTAIMPLKTHPYRKAKFRITELKPFGVGQFRAPDATPPFFKTAVAWEEKVISLLLLDEMEKIDEEEWISLNSSSEEVRRSAGASLIDRGRVLRMRNERLTEKMRWNSLLNGVLTVVYPPAQGGSSLTIGYSYSSGHITTAGTPWTTVATADPVADIQAWSEKLADDSGFYARHLHFNSKTYDLLVRNQNIVNQINFFAGGAAPIQRPRRQDILNLFTSFAVDQDITIYDNGYRAEGVAGVGRPSLTKYLPDSYVLVTTEYSIDGTNIADMLDGQVVVNTGYNSTDIRQGSQAEVMLEPLSKTHFFRYGSARVPRINYPDCILSAYVGA